MKNYLYFENDLKKMESELEKLKNPYNEGGLTEVDTKKISILEKEIEDKLKKTYSNLNPWQTTLIARHEDRPKAKFFIDNLIDNFVSLSGDRFYAEDKSFISGFGKFENQSVLVFGQEKGEDLDSRIERNFGMMRPEGYRKGVRLLKLADKFNIPVISFIDTPGAYPGVGAEERGQAEAIARSIESCMKLGVPNISIIIGEGGSGGAIALASSNKIIMLEHAIYSVISPEGCAAILWKDPKKTLEASEAMKLTSKDLLDLNIIDEIIKEPIGGAHREITQIKNSVKTSISNNLKFFQDMSRDEIISHRKNKFLSIGRDKGFINSLENPSSLASKRKKFSQIYLAKNYKYLIIIATIITIFLVFLTL